MKRFFLQYIYLLFFCWNISQVYSQNLTLKISVKDSINSPLIESLKYQEKHLNTESVLKSIDSLKTHFEKIGFFNNRLDTILKKDSIYSAKFILGKSNKLIRIYYDKKLLNKKQLFQITSKITDEYFEVDVSEISSVLNYLVSLFENKGNSFTEINLGSIEILNDLIISKLNIKTSEIRKIDKVIIKGFNGFPEKFIKYHFNINSETIFSRDGLDKISNQLKVLPFVSEIKPPEVLFTKDSTYIYLYLKKRKANKFDGLIGFSSDENNSGLQFNGYLDLALNNIFNDGETLTLNWKNNSNERQLFDFSAELPYILNSSLTPKFGLNIYKQDSTFINTKINFDLGYAINYRNKISAALISEMSTNLLDNPISDVENYSSNFYGLKYNYRTLNSSLLFPIKFNFSVDAFLGSRKSNGITTNQSRFGLNTNYLWSLNFKNHIFLQNSSSILISDDILTNELYRVGGINSIRGFNEESIFASIYSVVNLEYRYNTSNLSYLYSISDFGYIRNQLLNQSQQIFSLGLGYAFSTNFGLLNLSYALGKSENEPFDFNNSRFHISIVSFF